jgi:glutamate synthase (ferredoxin)
LAKARRDATEAGRSSRDACGVGFLADLSGQKRRDVVLPLALAALGRLGHRGAVDADGRTGDGAGLTTQIPHEVLRPSLAALEAARVPPGDLGVGLAFLPRREEEALRARHVVEGALAGRGLSLLGWRKVPITEGALGDTARRSRPEIAHVLTSRPGDATDDEFERRLYLARRDAEARAEDLGLDLYLASLSHRTLVYKALVRGADLGDFYPDLRNPEFRTALALFHQRFSTNTLPSWSLTQPFRLLAHNGEINTITGNRSWMRARERGLASSSLGLGPGGLGPPLPEGESDSASLDEALALLTQAGRDPVHALTLLMPPAFEGDASVPPQIRAFFEYQAGLMEPWDGPAFVVFTDGRVVGAALDRNGLRPARYQTTADGLVLVASEVGVLEVEQERIVHRGRLGPGDVMAVDLQAGRLFDRAALHGRLAARRPYAEWVNRRRVLLASLPGDTPETSGSLTPRETGVDLRALKAYGYTREEMRFVLGPMYSQGIEPLGSMGDDTPLAVLSRRPSLLFAYFKQRFAQVTNPPIDPLREALVMSLGVRLGPRDDLLAESPGPGAQVQLEEPLLDAQELSRLLEWKGAGWRAHTVSLLFPAGGGVEAFRRALGRVLEDARRAAEDGVTLLLLSDRGMDAERAALPSLLSVSAVHQHLIRLGLRLRLSLVIETGEARDDHHVAALIGFGAEAVSLSLAVDAVSAAVRRSGGTTSDERAAQVRYRGALRKGLLKILSKMGISTVRSYHGAQLFEAIGIAPDVVQRHFTGTPCSLGGMSLRELAGEVLSRHGDAYAPEAPRDLEEGGLHRYRQKGEAHAFEPKVVRALHDAARSTSRLSYRRFAEIVASRDPLAVRDLLEFRRGKPLPLDAVEPLESLFPRFMTAAMSLGALSPEVQQTLAIAMNRIGGRSNSGEGGEPSELYWKVLPGGDRATHRIKQVASARFGVTAEYLMAADELQIKIAQGSKPGEGGQLPGHKVAPHIARLRHASPGITLISPPPHHDIYSIEDLAQLIYDLKRVNPAARVSVKLVSSAGIGTIATGVAKAHADSILISGHDGGTGASPLGSIKNAGTPWELGLWEAQRALVQSGLRGRVRLQVDGGLKTGRDVVMAAAFGAEDFGFGTAALVAAGCVMARQCHLNTCPAGIATQLEDLRRKFRGTPEDVIRFFAAVGEEVREILALLGVRRLEEVVGRMDFVRDRGPSWTGKASRVSLKPLLTTAGPDDTPRSGGETRNDPPLTGARLDERVLERLRFGVGTVGPLRMDLPITNADRAVGARLAGELARRYRGHLLRPSAIRLRFSGSAGQSFGAFCVEGMALALEGEANDYLGKGMSGGEIVVRPWARGSAVSDQVIAGNTLLYGATGGRVFLAGRVGERFAVRNSGALAVVEGVGDHACEYMTSGWVVILGTLGRNLGAGMTGGVTYVLDTEGLLAERHNPELVAVEEDLLRAEEDWLRHVVRRHHELTGSDRAEDVLEHWTSFFPFFRRVVPQKERGVLPTLAALDALQNGGQAAVPVLIQGRC